MSFSRLGLNETLLATLAELGYARPTPVQTQAIPAILAGRDVLAAAQTGTGKTAAFALPLLQRLGTQPDAGAQPRALVLVPTRELAVQLDASLAAYGTALPLRRGLAYGGVPAAPQAAVLQAGVDIVVATPGRLVDLHGQGAVALDRVALLVLDEADRMLDLGFARELDALLAVLPRRRQTLLFSATFSDAIRNLAKRWLREPLSIDASPRNSTARNVRQWVVPVDKKRKAALLCQMMKERQWGQTLVFVKTRNGADELAAMLQSRGIGAAALHGDKGQGEREAVLGDFRNGALAVLVATDVAARGLDIDGLARVVNFDLPVAAADYIHRVGRTGRAGGRGEAVSLVCADEVGLLSAIENLLRKTLSRDEEPGFEPKHCVPPTVLMPSAPPKRKPQGKAAAAAPARGPGRPGPQGGTPGTRGKAPTGRNGRGAAPVSTTRGTGRGTAQPAAKPAAKGGRRRPT